MKTLKKLKLITLSFLILSFFGCNDSESGNTNSQNSTISIKLVDSPGDFEEVNVNVVDVMIKMNDDSDDENGWISLESNAKTINLLDLTGGVNEVLVNKFPIPAGTLKQMRLVLGDGNTIVIKNEADVNETHDLKTPSAKQSGLKLKVDAVIEEGFTYDYIIDFDVEKSIVIAGNSSNIILKPVLYVSTTATSGSIKGKVSPSDVQSIASLTDTKGTPETEDDEIISAYTDENGHFVLWGVPAGTYTVTISAENYTSQEIEAVVTKNTETVLDDITLVAVP